jgi:hypothetical protein
MAIAEAGRRRRQPRFPLKLAIIGGAVCCAAAGFQITASSKKGGSGNVYPSEPSLRPPAITPRPLVRRGFRRVNFLELGTEAACPTF